MQDALITTGTDSVCMVVPSLAHSVMLNDEFAWRPAGTVAPAGRDGNACGQADAPILTGVDQVPFRSISRSFVPPLVV